MPLPLRNYLLAALLGAASVFAFAPFELYPLAGLTVGGLYWLLRDTNTRRPTLRAALLTGFAFGTGYFLAGVSWVYVSMHDVGGMPLPLAALAALLFCLTLALFPALAAGAMQRLAPSSAWCRSLLFAAVWMLGEWLRGWVFSGFPWLLLGSSQTPPSPLAGFAPLLGVLGLSFIVAFIGAALVEALLLWRERRLGALCRLGVVAALLLTGSQIGDIRWTQAVGQPLSVALLQGNIEQEMKWRPERFRESLDTYYRLMREHPARLTVLPETALPSFYDRLPPDYLEALRRLARREQGDVLLGVVTGDGGAYRNAALSLGSAPEQGYAKRHLVPFGEFVPAGFSWFMALIDMPLSGFTAGPAKQAPLTLAGQHIAVNICYEDVFASEIAERAAAATLLINLSNTAWFGHSLAQPQHLQIARMRAMETGRPMLRATNTGMTALIEADGRVAAALPAFTRDALVVQVRGREGLTPYLYLGDSAILALAGLIVLLAVVRLRRGGD
jgi:apolipoprotein N-acyltransferase